ncbi:MAG: hypothetical protein HY438_02455 [DPANN group archaeon]|nr:hypothetical protein [DPANN group archaeon]
MSLIKRIAFAASKPFNRAADVIWVRPLHRAAGASKCHSLGALIKETNKDSKKITQAETYIKKCVVNFACEKESIVACEIIYRQPTYRLFVANCSADWLNSHNANSVNCLDVMLNDAQVYAIVGNLVYVDTPVVSGDGIDFSRKLIPQTAYRRAMALKGEFVLLPPPLFE